MTDPADQLREQLTPEVRPLMQQLRTLVKEGLPAATEKAHRGWRVFHYRAGSPRRDVLVTLAPHATYVNLEFGDGIDLPDPAHRLAGMGKRLRHVTIRSREDVPAPAVRAGLQAAAHHCGVVC